MASYWNGKGRRQVLYEGLYGDLCAERTLGNMVGYGALLEVVRRSYDAMMTKGLKTWGEIAAYACPELENFLNINEDIDIEGEDDVLDLFEQIQDSIDAYKNNRMLRGDMLTIQYMDNVLDMIVYFVNKMRDNV